MGKLNFGLWAINVLGAILVTILLVHGLMYRGKVMPRVRVEGVELTGLDRTQATEKLNKIYRDQPNKLSFVYQEKTIDSVAPEGLKVDINWAVEQSLLVGRSGNLMTRLAERIEAVYRPRDLEMPIQISNDFTDESVAKVASILNKEMIPAAVSVVGGKIRIEEGKEGVEVEEEKLKNEIMRGLKMPGEIKIAVETHKVDPGVSRDKLDQVKQIAEKWLGKELRLFYGDWQIKINDVELVSLLSLGDDRLDKNKFGELMEKVRLQIEHEPVDAKFVFEDGKVNDFRADSDGVKIDEKKFEESLAEVLSNGDKKELEMPVVLTPAKIKTGDINNLGLKELIGVGKSRFAHSIPGRVFNINLAASKINSVLIPPGEEFSFNDRVGDISRLTGYQTAYIIQNGRTVLGDGGGVCQVSTTVFRAALNAGLPILERKAHAYRVGYYEQDSDPGIDATVFSPTADLRFKNDTGGYILVQTKVDTKNLTMKVELYGTKDNREVTLTKPKIYSQTRPLPDLYQDDPSLPKGVLKQVDWSAWGAKVSFDYKVIRGGETLFEKTFFSNYQPWQAIYLRGTM